MRAIVALLPLLLGACYTYVPARSSAPGQGTPVRVHLSVPGDFRLAEMTANQVTRIDGEMIRAGTDSLALSAWWLVTGTGYEFKADGRTVVVPRGHVAAIREKRLSPARSGLFAAAGLLVGSVAGAALDRWGGGGGGGASKGGGTAK